MSHWRSALIAAAIFTSVPSFATPPTSAGPVSEEEGELLWRDGRAEARDGRCAQAALLLRRLVDRYPGHAHYIEAHLTLGECLLALDDAREAIQVLRFFTSGTVSEATPEARNLLQRGRIALGQAYLKANRGNEALLASREIAKHAPKDAPSDAQAIEGALIGAQAFALLNQDARAQKMLDEVRSRIPPGESGLLAQAAWTRMRLVERRCATLPGKGKMDEAQARDQISRRGSCLLESTVIARDALATGDEAWSKKVRRTTDEAIGAFRTACARVPEPKGKRSKTELTKYRAELADVLARDCAKTLLEGIRMLDGWKSKLPSSTHSELQAMRSAFAQRLGELELGGGK